MRYNLFAIFCVIIIGKNFSPFSKYGAGAED
jgi:hypothetical protein